MLKTIDYSEKKELTKRAVNCIVHALSLQEDTLYRIQNEIQLLRSPFVIVILKFRQTVRQLQF